MKTKLIASTIFALIILFASYIPVLAQEADDANYKFSVEASVGYHYVPGFILGLDSSITKHPDGLSGVSKDISFSYPLSKRWSIGMSLFDINSTGKGQWERSDTKEQFQQGGVDGVVTGTTTMRNFGFTADFKRTFRADKKLQPYVKFGTGLNTLNVKFNGKFIGHETKSGMNYPVVENASDRVKMNLLNVVVEGGAHYRLGKHILVQVAPYFNIGFGSKFGAMVTF